MLEYKRPALFTMTLGAAFIQARHGQSACGLEDIHAMRIVALHAIHAPFNHWMVLRQMKLRSRLQMALQAGGRISAGINNEFPAAATAFHVLAPRPMARFAAGFTFQQRRLDVNSAMWTCRKYSRDVGVAFVANFISHIAGPGNLRRRHDRLLKAAAGTQ